jgi:hypothetical protein
MVAGAMQVDPRLLVDNGCRKVDVPCSKGAASQWMVLKECVCE